MPVHLPAYYRRQFLRTVGVALVAGSSRSFADDRIDDDVVYLLNDTHIGEKHPPSSPVPSNLRQVVTELVQREKKPAAVLINGDLALKDGQPGDYRHFAELIAPLAASRTARYREQQGRELCPKQVGPLKISARSVHRPKSRSDFCSARR